MENESHIAQCISRIETMLEWGPSSEWTAHQFSRLSRQIFEKTGKTVSESTLKRFFGKKSTPSGYTPQPYTRDALAEFLGYSGWEMLKRQLKPEPSPNTQLPGRVKANTIQFALLAIFPLIIVAAFLFWPAKENKVTQASLELITSDTMLVVPYTAVFRYSIAPETDSVYIDFGTGQPVLLRKDKNTIAEFYKISGRITARLMSGGRSIDSVVFYNRSEDWQAGVSPNDNPWKFVPFDNQNLFRQPDRFYMPPDKIPPPPAGPSPGYYTDYRFTRRFNLSLDNLKFATVVKNPESEGGLLCFDAEIWLLGESGNCRVRVLQDGCFRYGQFQVAEKSYTGRFDDLSPFTHSLNDWLSVSVHTARDSVQVSVSDKQVFAADYNQKMGALKGIVIRFYGTGSIREALLKTTADSVVYKLSDEWNPALRLTR